MNTRTDNTQNTAEELRQAARRLGDGAAYVAREIPWAALVKGTFKLAINILRYSMGIAIYGLIIWPYRLLAAPTCAFAAALSREEPLRVGVVDPKDQDHHGGDEQSFFDGDWNDSYESSYKSTHAFTDDGPIVPVYVNQETNSYSNGDDVMDYRVR
jgi:hypothetical protein